MNAKLALLLPTLSLVIAGCATSYKLPKDSPSATYSLAVESDAASTTTRTVYTLMLDESCNRHPYGLGGGSKSVFGSDPKIETASIAVLAEKPLQFTTNYIDARFAQNKGCSVTGVFTPKTDHIYQARMKIEQDVSVCKLGIIDLSNGGEEQVDFTMPPYICGEGKPSDIKNGQAMQLNWSVKVVPASR